MIFNVARIRSITSYCIIQLFLVLMTIIDRHLLPRRITRRVKHGCCYNMIIIIIAMIIIFVVSTLWRYQICILYNILSTYTYVSDDKPPPSDSDDSLLDMMIRDGDFTKGFYTNVFACGLMLTNVCRINANNTIIIIQNVSCKPARNDRLKVICFR